MICPIPAAEAITQAIQQHTILFTAPVYPKVAGPRAGRQRKITLSQAEIHGHRVAWDRIHIQKS